MSISPIQKEVTWCLSKMYISLFQWRIKKKFKEIKRVLESY